MTKERKFKKAYAKELLAVAEGDLEAAKALHQAGIIKARKHFLGMKKAASS